MFRRFLALSIVVASVCSSSGCLFVRQSARIEREKESLLPVQFESEQARQYFLGGVHELQARKQISNLEMSAVPFLWFNVSHSTLSDNAIYNDQISACDTNGDGLIDMQEATAYRAVIAERVQAMDAKTPPPENKPENKKDATA